MIEQYQIKMINKITKNNNYTYKIFRKDTIWINMLRNIVINKI